MKTFSLIFFISLLIFSTGTAQQDKGLNIVGRITDEDTNAPISNASVFLENTTIGVFTNKNGEFFLHNIHFGQYTLTTRFVGYELQSFQFGGYQAKTIVFDIKLKPKSIVLSPVNIVSESPADWKANLKIFTSEFLGETENAKTTAILNPEVINFKSEEEGKILLAFTDSLIKIENRALGYRLYLYLDTFRYEFHKSTKYAVHIKFEELMPPDTDTKESWSKRRKEAYIGSRKHFLTALVNNHLENENYIITRGRLTALLKGFGQYMPVSELHLQYNADSTIAKLELNYCLKIESKDNLTTSLINPLNNSILIDKYGNQLDALSVEVLGYWGIQRIADMLPADYKFTDEK